MNNVIIQVAPQPVGFSVFSPSLTSQGFSKTIGQDSHVSPPKEETRLIPLEKALEQILQCHSGPYLIHEDWETRTVIKEVNCDAYSITLEVKIYRPTFFWTSIFAMERFSFSRNIGLGQLRTMTENMIKEAQNHIRQDKQDMWFLGWFCLNGIWQKKFDSFRLSACYMETTFLEGRGRVVQVELVTLDKDDRPSTLATWHSEQRLPLAVMAVELFGDLLVPLVERLPSKQLADWAMENKVESGMIREVYRHLKEGDYLNIPIP